MTRNTGSTTADAADSVIELATDGLALWQLAGYPDFPIPVIPGKGIPHGRILARVGRRVLDRYGHRLDVGYVEMLGRLFDQCEKLHFPLSVRTDPFPGFKEVSVIVRAFYEERSSANSLSASVQQLDALRCWLLVALHTLNGIAVPGKKAFLRQLAMVPGQAGSCSEGLPFLHEVFLSFRMMSETEAERWVQSLAWQSQSRSLAVATLSGKRLAAHARVIRPRLRDPSRSRIRRRPIGAPPTLQRTHSDDIPEEDVTDVAVEIEFGGVDLADDKLDGLAQPTVQAKADPKNRKVRAWAKQDARLRIVDGLLPHTELALTDREARDLYIVVSREVAPASGQPQPDQNLAIDVTLLLMLVTSRDYVSILHALHHYLADDSGPSNLNLRVAEDAWTSLPDHPLPDLPQLDSRFHSPHQREIEFPLPLALKIGIRHLREYGIDPMASSSEQIEARLKDFKKTIPRLTLGRLRNTLPTLLYLVTGHPRTIQLVIGTDGFRSPAPLHYYAPRHERISGHYVAALRMAGIAVNPRMLGSRLRVGAPRGALEIAPVAEAIGRMADRVRVLERAAHGEQRTVDLYNAVAEYTALMFSAYTAHRFSSSLGEMTLRQFVEFPSGAGIAVFDDKRSDGSTLRLAALPPEFFEQLNFLRFVAHRVLRYVRERRGANHPVTDAIEGSLTGRAPAWSSLDWSQRTVEPVTREKLQHACDGLEISVVLLRHVFATTAEEGGMPGADLAQQMGHRVDHTPYTNVDLDSPRQFAERVAPFLTAYGRALGLAVISTRRGQDERALSAVPELPIPVISRSFITRRTQAQIRNAEKHDGVQEADDTSLEVFEESGSVWIRLLESESRICLEHLDAYRTVYALEGYLGKLLNRKWHEECVELDRCPAKAQMCAVRLLTCIWGLTTDPVHLRNIESDATLFRVESSPWAVLWSPQHDTRTGIQLVSAEQAPLVQRLCDWRRPLDVNDTLEELKASDPRLSQILGEATFGMILQVIGAARQLTTPAHRAAWERGALISAGLRADRLLALMLKKSVSPLPQARPETGPWSAPEQPTSGSDLVAGYRSVRRALGDYADTLTKDRLDTVLREMRALSPKTIHGSLPWLLLNAIHEELDEPQIKISSLYGYVTRLSRVVIHSLKTPSESADPELIEELLNDYLVLGSQRKRSRRSSHDRHHALAWLIRRNLPEDILFDISEVLDGTDAYVRPPRAGDPVSRTEMHTVLTRLPGLEYAGSVHGGPNSDRTALVLELAAVLQSSHALRLREVWGLTTTDVKIDRDRCEIFVRPRRRFGLKGPASKRIISRSLAEPAYRVLRRLHGRIHPKLIDRPAMVELLPIPSGRGYREWCTTFYAAFNAARDYLPQESAGFRPHSHRHSYATGQAMAMQPEQFNGLVLDLPTDSPAVLKSLPRRVQYRYVSRQLGHGDPDTTLRYYDHSISLMLATFGGWRGPDPGFLADQLKIPRETFKKRIQRRGGTLSLESVVMDALNVPDLASEYEVRELPTAGSTEIALPEHPPRTIEFIAKVAIRLRSGRSVLAIAAEFDARAESIQSLHDRLVDAEQFLRVDYLLRNKSIGLQRAARTESLVQQLRIVERACGIRGSLCNRLFRVHTAFMKSVSAGRHEWESLVHDVALGGSVPPIGRYGSALLRITIFVYVEEFCAHGLN